MLAHIPPQFFSGFTLPQCDDGTSLTACLKLGDYEFYVRWLGDYLHTAEISAMKSTKIMKKMQKRER